MPKILVLTTEYPPGPGGIGTHARALLEGLIPHHWEPMLVARQENASPEEIQQFNANAPYPVVPLKHAPSLKAFIRQTFSLAGQCKAFGADLIVGSGKHASWYAYLIAAMNRKPYALIGHGTEFGQSDGKLFDLLHRRAYNRADSLIFVSHFTQKMAKSYGIRPSKPCVIHNGADHKIFYPETAANIQDFRKKKGLDAADQLLLTVGNMSPRKGQEWVIRALPHLLQTFPKLHYACVGAAQDQARLQSLANNLGVSEQVHLVGRQSTEEIRMWYNAATLYTITSAIAGGDFEGFGISVIEAALCGKCAVVSNNSGLLEAIVEGETGLAAQEKDPEHIAQTIARLLKDTDLRKKLETQAQQRAQAQLTWQKVLTNYHQLFEKLIQ